MRGTIHDTVDRILVTALVEQMMFQKCDTKYEEKPCCPEPDSEEVADNILRVIAAQLIDHFPEAAAVLQHESEF